MKAYFLFFSLVIISVEMSAQSNSDKPDRFRLEIKAASLIPSGTVRIKGNGDRWIEDIYPNAPANERVQKDHDGGYVRLGAAVSKMTHENLSLGVGLNVDIYPNIGSTTRITTPIIVQGRYYLPKRKNAFYLSAEGGYSTNLGGKFHAGLNAAGSLGYEIRPENSRKLYRISIGYNYQEARDVIQTTFTTNPDNGVHYLSGSDFKNLSIKSFPVQFAMSF